MSVVDSGDVLTLKVGGRSVRAFTVGSGPVILCSSGVASVIPDWLLVAELLAPDFQVVVFDRPGYAPGDPFTTAHLDLYREAARAVGVLDELGISEPVAFAGHSLGAFIAEAGLRYFPERFTSGVFIDGSTLSEASSLRPSRRLRGSVLVGAQRSSAVTGLWTAAGAAASTAAARGRRRLMHRFPHLDARFREWNFFAASVREFIDFNAVSDQLDALRTHEPLDADVRLGFFPAEGRGLRSVGSLFGYAQQRWLEKVHAEARMLARELPNRSQAQVHPISGTGHFIMLDQPEHLAEGISAFLRTDSAPGATMRP